MTVFLTPTTKVATFNLHGWCNLAVGFVVVVFFVFFVFLLALTRLGHECEGFFHIHAMECMHVQTRPKSMLSSERVGGSRIRTYVNSQPLNRIVLKRVELVSTRFKKKRKRKKPLAEKLESNVERVFVLFWFFFATQT